MQLQKIIESSFAHIGMCVVSKAENDPYGHASGLHSIACMYCILLISVTQSEVCKTCLKGLKGYWGWVFILCRYLSILLLCTT